MHRRITETKPLILDKNSIMHLFSDANKKYHLCQFHEIINNINGK